MYQVLYVENEDQLKPVLELCDSILGEDTRNAENYQYTDWQARINDYSKLLIYASENNTVIAAVLGRPESAESLVCGFVACHPLYRLQGITKSLLQQFETNAKNSGFKYITLGSDSKAEIFYEKCGYAVIKELHGQKIFQKRL